MTPEPKFRDPVHALLATQYLPPRIRTSNRDPQTPVPSPNQDPPRIHGTYPYLHVEIIKTQVERRTPPHQCFFFFLGSALAVWVQNFIIIITTNTEISRKINLEEFFFFFFQEGK